MRMRSVILVLAAVLAVGVVAVLPAAGRTAPPRQAAVGTDTPPDPDLRRAVMLSLARRAVPPGGQLAPVGGEDVEPYVTGPGEGSPEVVPPPPLTEGTGAMYAVGDSVLLGTEPYLRSTLAGWDVRLDARVSRGVPEGFQLVRMNEDRIGDVLVLVLGHNYGGPGFTGWLDGLLGELDDVQRIVLVTVAEWSPAQREVNAAIRRSPEDHPNVVVADWAAVLAANPQFLRDHVHPSRSGATALANLITVMVGPAPARDGVVPPRPRLLPIPDEPVRTGSGGSGPTGGGWPIPGGGGGGTTSTTAAPSTTSTTAAPSTTSTTAAPSTTATTAPPSSTTTAPPATATSTTLPAG